MRLNTHLAPAGPLAELDLVGLGARTNLLWRSESCVLVGAGNVANAKVRLDEDAALADMLGQRVGNDAVMVPGSGPVGFVTLPFDAAHVGDVLIPEIVVGQFQDVRFVTAPQGADITQVGVELAEIAASVLPPMPTNMRLRRGRTATAWRDEVVGRGQRALSEGSTRKAVFARELQLSASDDFPVATVLDDLARRFPRANLFAIDGFVGASPEMLVSRHDRTVRAFPLAGTAPRTGEGAVDQETIEALRASSKDRTEHQITIDWLLTELLPFCSYVDAEPEPSVLTLSNVHHLGTRVEGVLTSPPASVLELVSAVHPTPAVGGDPQLEALQLIAEFEGFDRGRYAGPTGWADVHGNGEFAVSVRTAQVRGAEATIWAGGGIVAQSDPDAELRETQAKFKAMLGSFLRS